MWEKGEDRNEEVYLHVAFVLYFPFDSIVLCRKISHELSAFGPFHYLFIRTGKKGVQLK